MSGWSYNPSVVSFISYITYIIFISHMCLCVRVMVLMSVPKYLLQVSNWIAFSTHTTLMIMRIQKWLMMISENGRVCCVSSIGGLMKCVYVRGRFWQRLLCLFNRPCNYSLYFYVLNVCVCVWYSVKANCILLWHMGCARALQCRYSITIYLDSSIRLWLFLCLFGV